MSNQNVTLLLQANNNIRLAECFKGCNAYGGHASKLNSQPNGSAYLFPEMANAVASLAGGKAAPICVVHVGGTQYAAEMVISGKSYICEVNADGRVRAGIYAKNAITGKIDSSPINGLKLTDKSFLFAAMLEAMGSVLPEDASTEFSSCMAVLRLRGIEESTKEYVYILCDCLKQALSQEIFKIEDSSFENGSIRKIPAGRLEQGTFKGGVLCGTPVLLFGEHGAKSKAGGFTMKEIMDLPMFKAYRESHPVSEWEKKLIPDPATDPDVADDALIVPEVFPICSHYVGTENDPKPIVNISWRGITGYGKSTGSKQSARILGKPFVVYPCSDETTTADFLDWYVPDTEEKASTTTYLPTIHEMTDDPVGVYEQLTGEADFSATSEMCLAAAYKNASSNQEVAVMLAAVLAKSERDKEYMIAEIECEEVMMDDTSEYDERQEARQKEKERKEAADRKYEETIKALSSVKKVDNGAPKFKLVESPWAKAARYGWLCEVQEASRIKKPGTLVGLNEYSRPGATIVLANGDSFKRHERFLCIFTDNIGYDSCRPIDPSVIRRWDESYTTSKLDKKFVLERIEHNVSLGNNKLLSDMYDAWDKIADFCRKKQIDRGSCTIVELERWVQLVKLEGPDSLRKNCITAVINKCSELPEEQEEILDAVSATCALIAS